MDEKYRLVFRGEILEGQHRAVVKRRLSELMELSDAQLENLFSGDPVVIKRDVDKSTAAKYQTLFKQAGGRLQVLPQRTGEPPARRAVSQEGNDSASSASGAGTDVRAASFTVVTNYAPPPDEPRAEIDAPDFDVAAVGTNILDVVDSEPVMMPDPDFELAEVGTVLVTESREEVFVAVRDVDFDVAEAGATIGVASPEVAGEAPDVSHLKLLEL
jgi:hypothetical protein